MIGCVIPSTIQKAKTMNSCTIGTVQHQQSAGRLVFAALSAAHLLMKSRRALCHFFSNQTSRANHPSTQGRLARGGRELESHEPRPVS
jgi:hypothetical protein